MLTPLNLTVGGQSRAADPSLPPMARGTLPSSGSNYYYYYYYYYLAFVPLGVVGFTILQGWRTWQKERRVDRQAARRGRPFEVATS